MGPMQPIGGTSPEDDQAHADFWTVRWVLERGCPRCGRAFDRRGSLEPDGLVKMVCKGCNTAYWIRPRPGH